MDVKKCWYCEKDKPVKAKGLCNACYIRWQKRGTPDYIKVRKPCSAEGCNELSEAHDLCAKHLKRWQRHGNIEITRPAGWGYSEKHPLYHTWLWLKRHNALSMEWNNFWNFVKDVGEKPKGNFRFFRIDKTLPASIMNYRWREVETSRQEAKQYQKTYRKSENGQRKIKDRDLRKQYGISLDEYDSLFDAQQGRCKICGKANMSARYKFLTVDHSHSTKKVRGLLCSDCNAGLGLFHDDRIVLQKAIEYLTLNNT